MKSHFFTTLSVCAQKKKKYSKGLSIYWYLNRAMLDEKKKKSSKQCYEIAHPKNYFPR